MKRTSSFTQAAPKRRRQATRRRPRPYARSTLEETKFHDVSVDDASVAAGMTINNLSIIAQGTTESERVGRKVVVERVSYKGFISMLDLDDAAKSHCTVRVMLVQDKQTNGAQFAATDLLELDEIQSFNNLSNKNRFKVLHSEYHNCNSTGGAPTGAAYTQAGQSTWVSFSRKVHIPIEYDNTATTGAIATVRSNNIYLCYQSNNGAATKIDATCRLRFKD